MNKEIVAALTSATQNILGTMSSTTLTVGEPSVKEKVETYGDVTGIIGMAGTNVNGNLIISFDEKSILGIVSRMLMEDFKSINQDVTDAVGEITNMICGDAKRSLAELGYVIQMASPMVITGKNVRIDQLKDTTILTIPFKSPEGSFVVETDLRK